MSGIVTPFGVTPTTWNPSDKSGAVTLSNANLTASSSAAGGAVRSIFSATSGKWYIELTVSAIGSSGFGFANGTNSTIGGMIQPVSGLLSTALTATSGSMTINSGTASIGSFAVAGASLTVCIAIDLTARLVWMASPTGQWNSSGTADPGTGTGGLGLTNSAWTAGTAVFAFWSEGTAGGPTVTANFGAAAFARAVPSGFNPGFGTAVPTTAQLTQAALEQWGQGAPRAQLTQAALEHWAAVGTSPPQVVLTQITLEQWASVQAAIAAQQARAIILA